MMIVKGVKNSVQPDIAMFKVKINDRFSPEMKQNVNLKQNNCIATKKYFSATGMAIVE